jgi:MoaD family protein
MINGMVTVNLFATYRLEAGVKSFQLEIPDDPIVGKVILAILEKYPILKQHWVTHGDELYSYVIVIFNGRDINNLPDKLNTLVRDGDQLGFFPPMAGG